MRGIKAEGGSAVVNTEWCSVHPSSDTNLTANVRLRTDEDGRTNALMTETVHRYDALAGCELAHAGLYAHNRYTRIPAMGPPSVLSCLRIPPVRTARWTRRIYGRYARWYRYAVSRRVIEAQFGLAYVYVGYTDHLYRLSFATDQSAH